MRKGWYRKGFDEGLFRSGVEYQCIWSVELVKGHPLYGDSSFTQDESHMMEDRYEVRIKVMRSLHTI